MVNNFALVLNILTHFHNFFLSTTESSFRLAVRMSTKHDGALYIQSLTLDPFFVTMYGYFHPIHVALKAAYDAWISQGGSQESLTLTLNQLLRLLSGTKADAWMSAVKVVHDKTSARFKEIFPDLKKSLQQGTQTQKIAAVHAISLAIGTEGALSILKTDVDTFYALLLGANTTQKGSISHTGILSDTIEAARVNDCIAQLADYGLLMNKYASTPEVVANYFDEAALRHGNQVLFHHGVKKTKVYTVCKHTSVGTDEFLLENDGDADLIFGFVLHKDDVPAVVFVTVLAHTNQTVHASDLSNDLTNNHYLVCYNANTLVDGEFTVEFL